MNTEPARILVVDDSPASRYITSRWLRRGGHDVVEAETGRQALDLLVEYGPDLVVLDVRLPDMSGFEVCELIKGDPATAALPVIHVSATFIEADDRAQGLTRGADAYLTEPVDPGELLATVEAALRYSRARVAAERLAQRLNLLTEASLAVYAAQSYPAMIAAAADGATAVFGAAASVLVTMSDGRVLCATTGDDGEPAVVRTHPTALVARLAAARLGNGIGADIGPVAAAPDGPDRDSVVVLVRTRPDQPATWLGVAAAAVTTQEDRNLLLQLGQATALAAQGLRSYNEEHSLALTLQRSLLPSRLPQREDLPVAVRYVPASANAEIGGDFYEVAELDGKVLVAIGDVAGHSIEAATIMGEVRHALRAYAAEGHGPAQIIHQLNVMLRRFHPRGYTTLLILMVDPATDTVTMANAGHLPPLLLDADGARYVTLPGALLGVEVERPAETTMPLPQGTVVVLMTDGLVERRGVPIDDDLEELRAGLVYGEGLEALCDRLLHRFGQNKDDDIALLVFQRR
jgi:CheY-like chemotaxis protein